MPRWSLVTMQPYLKNSMQKGRPLTEPSPLPSSGGSHGTTSNISPFNAAQVEPWDYYSQLLAAGEVVWDEETDAWLVSSYQGLRELASKDDAYFRSFDVDSRSVPGGMTVDEYTYFNGFGSK